MEPMARKETQLEDEGVREPLDDDEWKHLARSARASGKPTNLPVPRRTSKLLAADRAARPYRRPDWIGKLARDRAPAGEVLDHLSKRLERAPTEEALVEAGRLLEELSRTEEGQAEVSRRLTQQAVDRILTKGGGSGVD